MAVFTSGRVSPISRKVFLEYIESTGTQWIDTGYKPNNTTRIVMDALLLQETTESNNTYYKLFGGGTGGRNAEVALWVRRKYTYESDYGDSYLTPTDTEARIHVDANRVTVKINSVTILHPASTFQSERNLLIFNMSSYASSTSYKNAIMRLYSFQVYDDNVLVRDFKPCYDPDGVVCLYDKVTHQYYYNAGTGEFIAGMAA